MKYTPVNEMTDAQLKQQYEAALHQFYMAKHRAKRENAHPVRLAWIQANIIRFHKLLNQAYGVQ